MPHNLPRGRALKAKCTDNLWTSFVPCPRCSVCALAGIGKLTCDEGISGYAIFEGKSALSPFARRVGIAAAITRIHSENVKQSRRMCKIKNL
ncbi:hypothetical protein EVAR_92364_1 [Eumeta japonica]|uniref:Uncharacterized protein n=1 Tax=Eumeta variegata TaxID=151549 RepID=A0A4C1TIN6_EUMVA|nr:hypothetical protein EVAR_92364_1 [Eumeta japonica]